MTEQPNILLILNDDMGYSDLGCYGGEIDTPNLNMLAKKRATLHTILQYSALLPITRITAHRSLPASGGRWAYDGQRHARWVLGRSEPE